MAQAFRSSRVRRHGTVGDPRQAYLLTHPRSATFIYPFLGREQTTAQAAAVADCSISTMAYRIRVLQNAGLVELTRTTRRAGRPVNHYRSSHDTYHVPLALTGFADHADQVRRIGGPIHRRLLDAYAAALARGGVTTRVIGRDDRDEIYSTDQAPHRTRRRNPLLFTDRTLHLTRDRAEWLCARLDELIDQVTVDPGDPRQPQQRYLITTAAIPEED